MKLLQGKRGWEVLGSLLLLAVFVVPFFGFAKNDEIFVDEDASGTQNGSSAHPFKTIERALDEADKGDEVVIRSGTYEENITIPKDVKVTGAGESKVTIKADDDDEAVVIMKDKTKLRGVTVKDGKVGVVVKEDAKAEISDSIIKDNRHEGIVAKRASRDEKHKLSIVNVEIRDNGWSGIFSEKRKVIILESEIKNNRRSGIAFEKGVKAWIDNNAISKNLRSGMEIVLDESEVTVASKNTIRDNRDHGIEVQARGGTGFVKVQKSRVSENGAYGIARIAKGVVSADVWKGLTLEEIKYFGNKLGDVSPIPGKATSPASKSVTQTPLSQGEKKTEELEVIVLDNVSK